MLFHEEKCQETAEAEMIFNGTIKDTLAKTEALEKHVNNVTVRAEASATTADFFEALFDRQEEAQNHLNELSAQLSQQNTTTLSTQWKPHSTPGAQSLLFFPTSCQGPKRCGVMFARRQWERNDLALLMTSVRKAPSRAAHLMQ